MTEYIGTSGNENVRRLSIEMSKQFADVLKESLNGNPREDVLEAMCVASSNACVSCSTMLYEDILGSDVDLQLASFQATLLEDLCMFACCKHGPEEIRWSGLMDCFLLMALSTTSTPDEIEEVCGRCSHAIIKPALHIISRSMGKEVCGDEMQMVQHATGLLEKVVKSYCSPEMRN